MSIWSMNEVSKEKKKREEGIVIGFLSPPNTVEGGRVVPHCLSKRVSGKAVRNSEHFVVTIVILVDVGVELTLSRKPRVPLRIVGQVGRIHIEGAVSTVHASPLAFTEWSTSFHPKKRRKRDSPH